MIAGGATVRSPFPKSPTPKKSTAALAVPRLGVSLLPFRAFFPPGQFLILNSDARVLRWSTQKGTIVMRLYGMGAAISISRVALRSTP
jgi:hypothetical protein